MMFSTTTLSGSRSEQQQPCLHVFFSVFWIKIRNHAPGVLGCFARSFFSLLYFLCAIKLQASSVVVCLSVPFFATQVLCCSRADCRLSFSEFMSPSLCSLLHTLLVSSCAMIIYRPDMHVKKDAYTHHYVGSSRARSLGPGKAEASGGAWIGDSATLRLRGGPIRAVCSLSRRRGRARTGRRLLLECVQSVGGRAGRQG